MSGRQLKAEVGSSAPEPRDLRTAFSPVESDDTTLGLPAEKGVQGFQDPQ